MSRKSSAYVRCQSGGKTKTYYFTGVTSIEHNLSLNLEKDSSQGSDIINGARNKPNQVSLSVVETDAEHSAGWSARMLGDMVSLKKNRLLCTVVTSMATYKQMLLTEINATQDEENQCGWSGSLTFIQYVPSEGENGVKTNDNSSTRQNTGFTGNVAQLTAEMVNRLLETRL